MANLHTLPTVYSASLYAALTSQSKISFLVPLRIPGVSEPILTLIDSGATSNFIHSSLATISSLSPSQSLYIFRTSGHRLSNFLSQSFNPWPQSSSDCLGFGAPTPSLTGLPCRWLSDWPKVDSSSNDSRHVMYNFSSSPQRY